MVKDIEKRFSFNCEDREKERKEIRSFLDQDSQPRILWINGFRGSGKSFLVEKVLDTCDTPYVLITKRAEENENSTSAYLARVISALRKDTKLPLSEFIKANYESIADIAVSFASQALKLIKIDVDQVLESSMGLGKAFIDHQNNKSGISGVLKAYINNKAKNDGFLVVLDNFSLCDSGSLEVLEQVIFADYEDRTVQFIVITTEEDLYCNESVFNLLEKGDAKELAIGPFKEFLPFYAILKNNFDYEGDLRELAAYLHDLCNGYPQELKEVLRNIHYDSPMQFSKSKKWKLSTDETAVYLKSIYGKEGKHHQNIDLTNIGVRTRDVLQLACVMGCPLSSDTLIDLVKFTHNERNLTNLVDMGIAETIDDLIFNDIFDDSGGKIVFAHDSDYLYLSKLFEKSSKQRWMNQIICKYFSTDVSRNANVGDADRRFLIAHHAIEGSVENWPDIAKEYAYDCFDRALYDRAYPPLRRIYQDSFNSHDEESFTRMIEAAYETGEYNDCLEYAWKHEDAIGDFNNEHRIRCYLAIGKAHHINLDVDDAQINLRKALELSSTESERLSILAILISTLRSTSEGKREACELFLTEIERFEKTAVLQKEGQEDINVVHGIAICKLLRNSTFFLSNETACHRLEEAVSIAQLSGNLIEEAYCMHNRGVALLKAGSYEPSRRDLERTKDILFDLRPHEIAYPLQNLSALDLLEGNPEEALDKISLAEFWVKSPYVLEGLQTNRMMAYLATRRNAEVKAIADSMHEETFGGAIENGLILLGNMINLALVYEGLGDEQKCRQCITAALKPSSGTASEYRSAIIYNRIMNENVPVPTPLNNSAFYTTLTMDPFLISFAHD